jgi:low affinity Fe/Cu permease
MPNLADAPTKDLQARLAVLKEEIQERRDELVGIKAELEERGRAERAKAAVASMTPAERDAHAKALAEAAEQTEETER